MDDVDALLRHEQFHHPLLPKLRQQLAERAGGADAELLRKGFADPPEEFVFPGVGGEGDALDVRAEQFGEFFLAAFMDAQPGLHAAFAHGAEVVDRPCAFAAHLERSVVTDDHDARISRGVGSRHHVFRLSAIRRPDLTSGRGA
ncbi:MAG: hypothetical protein QM754_01640 [Tepidisphaeraceae bacterium]